MGPQPVYLVCTDVDGVYRKTIQLAHSRRNLESDQDVTGSDNLKMVNLESTLGCPPVPQEILHRALVPPMSCSTRYQSSCCSLVPQKVSNGLTVRVMVLLLSITRHGKNVIT